ncbi:MAG: MBL fold metallo-hydrolase [Rhodothermales bacterium]|nr:MBL fold metallo-hydrolase [Rhodothermales bacterium]MCA0267797.1 MBL fold metallo-hydrolase [Bacteroidota bacterium]
MRLTFLGTGTSTGVPVIGCGCDVCTSLDPRDRRLRTAALVEAGGLSVVIDTGPDFRTQALRAGMTRLDAVLFTHAHYDHVAGLDDVRPFLFDQTRPIPCYAAPATAAALRRVYPYAWGGDAYPGVPVLALRELDGEPFVLEGRYDDTVDVRLPVVPVLVQHGTAPILGFRLGSLAYLTDVSAIPDTSLPLLEGLDVLVLDALRPEPHPMHLSLDEAVAMAEQIGARHTYFVHMAHQVRHAAIRLPAGMTLAYDGLAVNVG